MEEQRNYQFIPLGNNENVNNNGNYQLYSLPVINQNNNNNVSDVEEEEGIDIRQLLNVAKHRIRLIARVAIGVTLATGIYIFAQKPTYEGTFQVLVGKPTSDDSQMSLLAGLGGSDDIDYETQIEVLRSPSVLEPIIEKLSHKYPDIEYEDLITEKKSPLTIKQLRDTKILQVSYQDTDPEKIQFILENLADAYLRYSLEQRKKDIDQGIEFVDDQLPVLKAKVDSRQEELQRFRQKHNLLDPEKQAEQISKQLIELENQYFATSVALNEYKTNYALLQQQLGLEPLQAMASSYLSESTRYQKLLNQLQAIEVKLAAQSTVWEEDSPIIQALQEEKEQLLPLLNVEAKKALGNHFSTHVSNSESLATPSSLRLELNQQFIQSANQIQVLEVRRSAQARAIESLNENVQVMPAIARQYANLLMELKIATQSLQGFLTAKEKLQLEVAKQALPWQLIASPELPEDQIFPKPPLHLTMGLIVGVLLGFGSAILAERLDPVFHSIEELKETVPLIPILGFIPAQKDLKTVEKVTQRVLPQIQIGNTTIGFPNPNSDRERERQRRYNSSAFLEAFRFLNTNIRLLGFDSPIRSLVISSSEPAEGKSTVSIHLAKAASAMGQRVLLIDTDLRRPQVHCRFGLKNKKGLSNVIAKDLDLETAIQTVPQCKGLSVVTAGDIPPDPTRLLSSQRMHQIMKQLEEEARFDLVIYDTPPMLGFADARILAKHTTGMILVAKIGKTDRSALRQSIDILKMSKVSILGLVANNAINDGMKSHYYYDRYYSDRPDEKEEEEVVEQI